MVGIVTNLCWKVEGNAQTGLSMLQKIFVSLIRLLRGSESRILAHCPKTTPIHGGLDSPGEWELSGKSQLTTVIQITDIQGAIETFPFYMGSGFEGRLPFGRF